MARRYDDIGPLQPPSFELKKTMDAASENLIEERRRTAAREQLLRTRTALEERYGELLAREAIRNPLVWGRYATRTKDEQDRTSPYKPFPDWPFFDYLLPVFQEEGIVFIKKSRTVMASWLVTLVVTHEMFTRKATGVIFQSRDEERAVHDVEYSKELWTNSISQLRDRWPLVAPIEKQKYNRLECSNGSWCMGISGDPKKINSEHPSIVVLDEAALMDRGADSFASALATKARLIIALSSAEPGWFEDYISGAIPQDWPRYSVDFVEEMRKNQKVLFPADFHDGEQNPVMMSDPYSWSTDRSRASLVMPMKEQPPPRPSFGYQPRARAGWRPSPAVKNPCQGIQFSRTRSGVAVVHLHYTARPDMREPAEIERLRSRYPSLAFFEKELEMRATALSGSLVFPDFDPHVHVINPDKIPKTGCRFLAIDPHPRTPHFFLWLLIDRWSDHYIYRELWPSKICGLESKIRDDEGDNQYTIKEYTETVASLEGNKIEWFHPETDKEYGVYRQQPGGEKIIERLMDQAGKAFNSRGEGEKSESYWERYERYGLYCQDPNKRVSAGEDAIRDLLKIRRTDRGEWPRLHVSSACPELILELKRYKYQTQMRQNEEKELKQRGVEARRHGVDCLRYLAIADLAWNRNQES